MSPDEYTAAVASEIARQTGWTEQEAHNMVADLDDMRADGLTPSDAATEILLAAAD